LIGRYSCVPRFAHYLPSRQETSPGPTPPPLWHFVKQSLTSTSTSSQFPGNFAIVDSLPSPQMLVRVHLLSYINCCTTTYLKFQAVYSLMSTEHNSLVSNGSCNRSSRSINKPPNLVKWSPFLAYDTRKLCWIQPYQIQRSQQLTETRM